MTDWGAGSDFTEAINDAKEYTPNSKDWWLACGEALTSLLHHAEEQGASNSAALARSFGRVCMKTQQARTRAASTRYGSVSASAQQEAMRKSPKLREAARRKRSLRGYEGALPAGGEVFEDGSDLAEGRRRGLRKPKANKDGRGDSCVYDTDGKLVRCFAKMETAREVARGFGSGFRAKKRRG
jgi:hypothetical protein